MFEYQLPPELIADRPLERGQSRLLIGTADGGIEDKHVYDLPRLIEPGTLMLLNNTKVISCRFFPSDIPNSEVFLVREISNSTYKVLFKPKKKFKIGLKFTLSKSLTAEVLSEDKIAIHNLSEDEDLDSVIAREGMTPIPPYIRDGVSDDLDKETYQTVFAKSLGSVAAPTASLHFSSELLQELLNKGVEIKFLTLHVGLHSMLSVERQLESGKVGQEQFFVPRDTLEAINLAKKEQRPVLGVGTTVTRAVESLTDAELQGDYDFEFRSTDLFIKPGFKFRVMNKLMTNFHLSGSTHLSLVSAFYGEDKLKKVYQHAVEENYRFYSYGDSMLLDHRDMEGRL